MSGKDVLRKHLRKAQLSDAINRLAALIDDGPLLAATDPAGLLNAASDAIEDGREIKETMKAEDSPSGGVKIHRAEDRVQ